MVVVSNVTSESLHLAWQQPAYFADQIRFEDITYNIIVEGKKNESESSLKLDKSNISP